MNNQNLHEVDWSTLPTPEDDGGADHLTGMAWPDIALQSTGGNQVRVGGLPGKTIIFAYPMTGRPDIALPDNWDMIPGARGCTPQACAFRDLLADLKSAGVENVLGLSTQTSEYQKEAATRLHLPFEILSDGDFKLIEALRLPIMEVEGNVLLKRLTMIVENGKVTKVFYPVFPPDRSAQDVLDFIS